MAPTKKKTPKKASITSRPKRAEKADLNSVSARLGVIESKLIQILGLLEKGGRAALAQPSTPFKSAPVSQSTDMTPAGSDADTALFLSRTPLFAKLSPQECAVLAAHCETKNVAAGQKLFSEGDFGDAMYILKQGVLEIFKKDLLGDVRIAEIRPGGLVGEMALVDGKPRSANVKAAESARLLSLSRAAYNDLKRSHAQVATKFQDELLLLISSRLRQTTEKLVGK
jgi:hypothetical protein